ncbi:SAVED domain-containing protein [Pseudofrankia sp. BMG5.37]|uniref:SAVED domain-containing protein n=1 Tax=Pseudofrankia sp. BMG5.37 TaxID=3050035 RepID=UPI002893A478|nr:SAVED domain-containing protein [Pseudofrankia sp. BMG5.37]MDT3440476.1 SAVED domain-containing protein [Pseudofrankia sp. BMG5.37]
MLARLAISDGFFRDHFDGPYSRRQFHRALSKAVREHGIIVFRDQQDRDDFLRHCLDLPDLMSSFWDNVRGWSHRIEQVVGESAPIRCRTGQIENRYDLAGWVGLLDVYFVSDKKEGEFGFSAEEPWERDMSSGIDVTSYKAESRVLERYRDGNDRRRNQEMPIGRGELWELYLAPLAMHSTNVVVVDRRAADHVGQCEWLWKRIGSMRSPGGAGRNLRVISQPTTESIYAKAQSYIKGLENLPGISRAEIVPVDAEYWGPEPGDKRHSRTAHHDRYLRFDHGVLQLGAGIEFLTDPRAQWSTIRYLAKTTKEYRQSCDEETRLLNAAGLSADSEADSRVPKGPAGHVGSVGGRDVTDPLGRVFISYRRARAADVGLLVRALKDVGVPVWQDVADLRHQPTEEAIRASLRDPATGGAVLFLTPEVANSSFIRGVEVPEILRRRNAQDGFWVLPVAAGGLGHKDTPTVLRGVGGAEQLASWNQLTADDPFTAKSATKVAVSVVLERFATLADRLPPGSPIQIRLNARTRERRPDDALVLDWTDHFTVDAPPDASTWTTVLLPALKTVNDALQAHGENRPIVLLGSPSMPAAFAMGHAFSALDHRRFSWLQHDQLSGSTTWALAYAADDAEARRAGWKPRIENLDTEARDLAVLVNVTQDTSAVYAASLDKLPAMRARIVIDREDVWNEPPEQRPVVRIGTAAEAASLAHLVRQSISNVISSRGPITTVHLFFAAPTGLVFMTGQLTNTLPTIVTYDYRPDAGVYSPAATLRPPMAY